MKIKLDLLYYLTTIPEPYSLHTEMIWMRPKQELCLKNKFIVFRGAFY